MSNNRTLTALIFTRDINNNPEKLTIYARITVGGKRAEISLKKVYFGECLGRFQGRGHWYFTKIQVAK